MSADTNHRKPHASPLDRLRVSIDAHTLDITAGKRRFKAIEPDGSLGYEDSKTPSAKLTELLERIWNEYPNGLLDLTEETLLDSNPDAPAVQDPKAVEEPDSAGPRDGSRPLSWEEMEKLRSETFFQLNDARNELWYVLELAKTLSQSSSFTTQPPSTTAPTATPKKVKGKGANKPAEPDVKPTTLAATLPGDPPVLPAGTYSVTPSLPLARPMHLQVYELELALGAKQQALDECSAMIDSAVDELQSMAESGDTFWSQVRTLKNGTRGRGRWAVVPKPDFGRAMADGEKARDVIIPYAVDEAPPALRARCLAAFDLDPTKKDSLTFGARSHLRLRVTYDDGMSTSSSSLASPHEDASDVQGMMEAAQLEAFDEDLINEIRMEALRDGLKAVDPRSVKVEIPGGDLSFELYDTRNPPATSKASPISDLIVFCARLSLIQLHRGRKGRYILGSNDGIPFGPSILSSIVRVLRFKDTVNTARTTLQILGNALTQAGLATAVVSRMVGMDDKDLELLQGILTGSEASDQLGGSVSLQIQGCRGVSLDISPSETVVTTSRASFPLTDLQNLPQILAFDIVLQLLPYAAVLLKQALKEDLRSSIFVDELKEVVSVGQGRKLRLSLHAPFDVLYSTLSGVAETGEPLTYDSRVGGSLLDWVRSLPHTSLFSDGMA